MDNCPIPVENLTVTFQGPSGHHDEDERAAIPPLYMIYQDGDTSKRDVNILKEKVKVEVSLVLLAFLADAFLPAHSLTVCEAWACECKSAEIKGIIYNIQCDIFPPKVNQFC